MAIENNFKIKHGLVVSTTATIQSSTQATSTTTGALQVVGGVGIGRNLYVGGTTFLAGDLYVDGTQFSVNSTNIVTGDRAIYLSTGSNTAIAATGSGLAIGPENSTYASFLFDGSTSFKSKASIVPTTSTYSLGSQELSWNTLYAKNAVISGVSGYIRANNTGTLTGNATIPGADISGAVSTATNLAGGTSGSLSYQSASGQTSFTDAGSSGWLLSSNGTTPQWIDPTSLTASTSTNSLNTFINSVTSGVTYYLALSELTGDYSPIDSDTALSYNTTDNKLTTTKLAVSDSTNSTSTITGAVTVAGGVGIGGDLYVGGNIVANKLTIQYTTITTTLIQTDDIISTYNTTASTGTTTGALQIAGGAGIGGNVNVGGNIKSTGNVILNSSALVHDQTAITVSTTIVTLDTFAITDYRSAKYVISVSNSGLGQFQTSEVALVHNNIDSFINQTSVFSADTPLMTFTTLVSSNNVLLKGVGANTGNTVKVQKIYITI